MDTLFLDFCSHRKLFALVRGQQVVSESELTDHTDEAAVLPAIETLLQKDGRTFKDIGCIAAVTGPGGFMSQRVGLSVANALAWSLRVPIAGLHLSDLYAARVSGDALWIHSTKKHLFFVRGFGTLKTMWPEPTLVTLDELKTVMCDYVGEVLPEQAAVLAVSPVKSMKDIADVLPAVIDKLTYTETPLTPWYGRGA